MKEYKENPVIDSVAENIRHKKRKRIMEEIEDKEIDYTIQQYQDQRTYGKFFVSENLLKKVVELNHSSMLLLFYILEKMEYGKSEVYLTSAPFCKETGLSRASFYASVELLIKKGWIFKMEELKVYSINLHRFSKGPVEKVLEMDEMNKKREMLLNHKKPKLRTREDNIRDEQNPQTDGSDKKPTDGSISEHGNKEGDISRE